MRIGLKQAGKTDEKLGGVKIVTLRNDYGKIII
jgi:hypothetical protein